MKAIQFSKFGGRDVLEYIETPKPVPQDDELLIEVTASGVNFVDIRERMGVYARAETHVGQDKLLPRISGLQVVGYVVDTGPSGDRGLIGKKVMALLHAGGYAQFAVARADRTVRLPEDADDVMFAAIPTQGMTAWLMLNVSTQLWRSPSFTKHWKRTSSKRLVRIAKVGLKPSFF